jgi:hypothetical protein
MAEELILEFTDVTVERYDTVNGKLGVDMKSGTGDWPAGLQVHIAGRADDGHFIVTEIWSSREAQDDFMRSRLGAALAAAGLTSPPKVTWVNVISHQNPGA